MRDERDLSGVCNKVCFEPLYTGKCKEECAKRYRKVFAVTGPASLRPKGEWISVEDRLPKDGVRVLALHEDGVVRIGISRGYFPAVVSRTYTKTFGIAEVTHWMPLPAPPNTEVVHDS